MSNRMGNKYIGWIEQVNSLNGFLFLLNRLLLIDNKTVLDVYVYWCFVTSSTCSVLFANMGNVMGKVIQQFSRDIKNWWGGHDIETLTNIKMQSNGTFSSGIDINEFMSNI